VTDKAAVINWDDMQKRRFAAALVLFKRPLPERSLYGTEVWDHLHNVVHEAERFLDDQQ
jgi:hypothetical protein